MIAFDSDPSLRWLFVFAHPDDEVGIAAWMGRLQKAGNPVQAIWLHHTKRREFESREVCHNILGIPQPDLHFWGQPDGECVHHLFELQPRMKALIDNFRPDRVVTIAYEQGHLDHDASNLLVRASYDGVMLEFPMYQGYYRDFMHLGEFAQPEGRQELVLTASERNTKKLLPKLYTSQTMHRNLVAYGLLRLLMLSPVHLDRRELLRVAPKHDFREPFLPERIAAKVRQSKKWAQWREATEPFLVQFGL